ncbi:MAG: amino acid ABC transporter substrate-binding protein [Anaerolineae bacterium]|nr:amino acid ABC transporter substrate-binding protein [Anaerolineae bacterium]
MKNLGYFLLIVALLSATLAACGGEEATQAPVAAQTKTVILGFTSSKTGSQEVPSTGQTRGLELWLEQVNAQGITLPDGTVVKFEVKTYDDESNKERVQQLYTKLINDDKTNFLISPYSSGLTDAAAVIAEQYSQVMVTTGAASDATYQKGYKSVYQLYTPASRYLTGAVDLLANLDPAVKKIAFVYENDKFSTDVVNAAKTYAEGQGYEVVLFEGYDSGTADFAPFINKITGANPDAIMGGGHFADGSTFAKQLHEKQVLAKFIALLVAPPELKFADIGDAALGVIGPSQWEPQANYTQASAQSAGIAWYGPSVADFVSAYNAKYGENPAYHAAGGYAAGLILQKAIETAGSVEPDKIRAALDAMDLLTFYGHVKFNTTAEAHGLQTAHEMVYIQWQKDAAGALVKQVVWPAEGKSADAIYPLSR